MFDPTDLPPAPSLPSAGAVREAINPTPGWAARLFAGTDPLASGLLQPQDARTLGRNALLNAGLDLLANSGPAPYRRGIGELLGHALQAGQQAYQQGVAGTVNAQQTVAQRLAQSRLDALRARYAGRTDPESMRAYMMGLIGEGDYHGASAISELLKSQQAVDPALQTISGVSGAALGLDPRKTYTVQRNRQGQIVGDPLETTAAASPEDRMQQSADLFDARQFASVNLDPKVRQAVRSFRLFQSHLKEAETANPEAYRPLVGAFAASADPAVQLRLGTLQYFATLNPSLAGQANILLDKLRSGTIPQEDLRRLNRIIEGNYNEVRQQYQDAYDELGNRSPGAVRHVPSPGAIFGGGFQRTPGNALDQIGR